ncbi:hypothetical protein Acr_11g0006910 [Actinidia rufa]|uniref:Bet v I/Major latex protein domain-containing protein n=1 Tax=Actinidia rufa TaxID=165716 RepID=A0A7J0FCH8_9ERIC|nr:hypothetical protein Acr_11g0006910 [Actinidia rufa]
MVGNSESAKEEIEAIDGHKKSVTSKFIEGEILNHSVKSTIEATTKGEGSLMKWTMEYEKKNEANLGMATGRVGTAPNNYLGLATTVSKDIEAYLLSPKINVHIYTPLCGIVSN